MDTASCLPPLPMSTSPAAISVESTSPPPTQAPVSEEQPLTSKLRLMCSYGGHIIPRPHDKTLCYVGGETRILVIPRNSSLASLSAHISKTLLNNRPFTLKYQLPNEDLDSLISVTTDEDLDNMLEEYDRLSRLCVSKPARIRLFLFFLKPDTAMSMGALIGDAKTETWFVDALNRGLSDSATIDNLLNLDGVVVNCAGPEQPVDLGGEKQSMPNSPMVENSSSFGSGSSTPSMANLPPIRTRVEVAEQKERVEIDEQFAQMGLVSSGVPVQPVVVTPVNVVPGGVGVTGEFVNRVVSDDERSDQGVPVGMRKPPLPMQLGQPRAGVAYNLQSPDSVASDGSLASASSLSRQMFYQEQVPAAPRDNRAPASPTQKTDASVLNHQVHMQQVQVPRYMMQPQVDQQQQQQQPQQQFVHAGTHYIAHPPSGQVPMPSYYQVYAHPPSQQQQQVHHPSDQQYPVYVMPMMQPPQYTMSMQSNIADSTTTAGAANRTMASPNPNLVASTAAYKDGIPPMYSAKAPSPAVPEMSSGIYKTAGTSTPQLVQIPSNQYQPQYVGYSQMQHPPQSISVASSAGANYGYEYASSAQDQGYYTQHPNTGYPAQYQTMTAAAAIELSDASKQLPTEQQNRPSQP